MPRIPHSILLKAYKKTPLLPLVLRGSRTLPLAINELRWLVEHVQEIFSGNGPSIQQQTLIHLCRRRSRGEPLQYIVGSQPFGHLDIKCRPRVLIPRPETESYTTHLAELINSHRLDRVLSKYTCQEHDAGEISRSSKIPHLRILDLCTGSGCIPLLLNSLLSKSVVRVESYGWDISEDAISLAKENLAHNVRLGHVKLSCDNHLRFDVVDIFDLDYKLLRLLIKLSNQKTNDVKVDIIISNPPYISQEAFKRETTRSVRNWEPRLALVPAKLPPSQLSMGIDGADIFYQRLLVLHSDVFRSQLLVMEVGDEAQAIRVARMALGHCNSLNIRNARERNCVEIWKDSPETDELQELQVGGDMVLVKGTGNFRAVVSYKHKHP